MMRIYHSNSNPDSGSSSSNVTEEFAITGYFTRLVKTVDPANGLLKRGDVVAIKCPLIRDHLYSDYCVKDYLGTISEIYGGSKYQVILSNSIGNTIYVDCDLEDLSIK